MSSEAFGRKHELYVGETFYVDSHTGFEGEIPTTIANPSNVRSQLTGGFVDFNTISERSGAVKIESPIHVLADCKYKTASTTGAGSQSLTSIKIYNLSETTIKKIKADATVIFKAGYSTDKLLPTVFTGTIETVSSKMHITTLICKEASVVLRSARIVGAYSKGQLYTNIFDDIVKVFKSNGVALGYFSDNIRSVSRLPEPRTVSGKVEKVLSDLCNEIGFDWIISRGKLFIYPIDEDQPRDFLIIKPENIIGKINLKDSKDGKSSTDPSVRPDGVKLKVFLDGLIGLENYITLAEGEYSGDYKISSIIHKYSFKGGDSVTEIEAQKVKV